MASELERTRTDLQVHRRPEVYPPGTRMLTGRREDLEAYVQENGARAVGRWVDAPGGVTTVPVVYVSKRARVRDPFIVRHRWPLVWAGSVLMVLALLAGLILWVGWAWFIGGTAAAAFLVATIVRYSRGGGGRTGNINININANTGRR